MTQSVNVPGVGTLQFPDGMSHDDMAAAIKKNFPEIHEKQRMSPAEVLAKSKAAYAAANTPEAKAKAYKDFQKQQVASMDKLPIGVPGVRSLQFDAPVPGSIARGAAGAGKAVYDTARGVGEIIGKEGKSDVAQSRTSDQALMDTASGKVGNILGYVGEAAPAVLAGTAGAGTAALGLGARTLVGGVTGGAQGFAAPYASTGEHVANTLVGAGLGAAMPFAGAATGNVMRGLASPEAREALKAGVRLTPGGMIGGAAKTVEDKLTSWPLVGGAIRKGQARALDDFNLASVQKALDYIGVKVGKGVKAGYEAIQDGREAISKNYDTVLGQMQGRMDGQLTNGLAKTLNNHINTLPENLSRKLIQTVDEDVVQRLGKGQVVGGKEVKEVISSLGNEIRSAMQSQDPAYRQLGTAYQAIQDDVKSMLKRHNPKELGEQLTNADAAHAHMLRVENAASRVGADEGKFTPSQLKSAARAEDSSYKKRGFSQGKSLMQDWADVGKSTLSSKVPDSGTAGRVMMAEGLLGSGGLGGALMGHPGPLLTALGISAAAHSAYSRPGQYLMQKALAPQASPVRNYLANLMQQRLGSPANSLAMRAMAPQNVPQVPQQ